MRRRLAWTLLPCAACCLAVLLHYLHYCLFLENPRAVTLDGKRFTITYAVQDQTRASTTIRRQDPAGGSVVVASFAFRDADQHLGTVEPPAVVVGDCTGDGRKDLWIPDKYACLDAVTEQVTEITGVTLPFPYASYYRWHHDWPLSFPRYSYSVIILLTFAVMWGALAALVALFPKR